MVEFFNSFTKTSFWVADDRVDEYKAAGYMPVANLEKPKVKAEKTEEEPVKTTRRVTRRR